jgi:nucleoid DNA-binding protein
MKEPELSQFIYRFLILNGKVSLPGIGSFEIVHLPAINDLSRQHIISPSSITKFSNAELPSETPALLNYLVRHLNISERNAFDLVSVFCSDIKNDLEAGSIISWKGLGKFEISSDGVLVFENQHQNASSNQDLGNTTSTALNYNYHQDDVEDNNNDSTFKHSNKIALTYLIDFKTSSKLKQRDWIHGYFMQTSAYAVAFEERTSIPVSNMIVIMAVENEQPLIFVEKRNTWIGEFIKLRQEYRNWKGI